MRRTRGNIAQTSEKDGKRRDEIEMQPSLSLPYRKDLAPHRLSDHNHQSEEHNEDEEARD